MNKSVQLLSWFVIAGVTWGLGYSYNVYNGGLISWLRAMYENKVAMAAEIKAPRRLLITGGSGAHYTVNSELLQEKLGLPVFNFSLDGNLGLNVIFPLIAEQVKQGDIVLLIPEYLMLMDDDGINERTAEFGTALLRPGLGDVPLKEQAQDTWLLGIPTLRSLTKASTDLIQKGQIEEYYADPLTENGDPTKTWERKSKWWPVPLDKSVTPHSLKKIAEFKQEVEAKGGTLILSLPVVYTENNEETRAKVRKTAEDLGKIAPLIYDPNTLNLKFEPTEFADTQYHLKPEARITRSEQIIRELKPILESLPEPVSKSEKS